MKNITDIIGYSPQRKMNVLKLSDLLGRKQRKNLTSLHIAIGRTWDNQILNIDFNDLGSLLVAGASKVGKTAFINSIILNLAYHNSSKEIEFLVGSNIPNEFDYISNSKYVSKPIIHDYEQLTDELDSLINIMEKRYEFLEKQNETQIYWHNWHMKMGQLKKDAKPVKYIFFILDNYSEILKPAPKKLKKRIDDQLVKLMQLGRAAGIYVIFASEDWSDYAVNGNAKVYFMNRVVFKTLSKKASEDAIWEKGAEKLLNVRDAIISRHGDGGVMLRIQTPEITKLDERIIKNEQNSKKAQRDSRRS